MEEGRDAKDEHIYLGNVILSLLLFFFHICASRLMGFLGGHGSNVFKKKKKDCHEAAVVSYPVTRLYTQLKSPRLGNWEATNL